LNLPKKEIIKESKKREDFFVYIILWMLYHNSSCRWKDFTNDPLKINSSTLSSKLKSLINKGYIKKINSRYEIKDKGKKKFKKLENQNLESSIPKQIEEIDEKILWLLYNNRYCQWKDFKSIDIVKSTLYNKLNTLIDKKYIEKVSIPDFKNNVYQITSEGKKECKRIIDKYNLNIDDSISAEKHRALYQKREINAFFEEYEIIFQQDDDLKFRFIQNLFEIDLQENNIISQDDIKKIVLYISMNTPIKYPKIISVKNFSDKYKIDENKLKLVIDGIIKGKIKSASKFFPLKIDSNQICFIRKGEELEKLIRAVVEKYYTKMEILNRIETSNQITELETNQLILNKICYNIFAKKQKDFRELIKEFLNEYLKDFKVKLKSEYRKIFSFDTLETYYQKDKSSTSPLNIEDLKSNLSANPLNKEDFRRIKGKNISEIKNENEIYEILGSLERDGKYSEYIEKIDNLIKSDPSNVGFYVRKSRVLCDFLKEYEQALDVVNQGLKIDNQEISLYVNKAMILLNLGKLDKALAAIEEALEIDDQNPMVLFKKSYLLTEKGEFTKALKAINKAIQLDPEHYLSLELKYDILEDLNKFEEAIKTIDQALKLKPENVNLYINKSRILCDNLKKYDLALKAVKQGLNVDAKEPSLYINKAMILSNMQRLDAALEAIDKALELDPKNSIILFKKAYLLYEKGEFENAINLIEKAIKLSSHPYYYYLFYVDILAELRRFDESLKILEKVLEKYPNDPYAHAHKARMLIEIGKFKNAMKSADKSLEYERNYIYGLQMKSIALRGLKKIAESLEVIDKAISINNKDLFSYEIKAETLEILEDNINALKIIDELIAASPEEPYYYIMKSRTLARLEKYQDALRVIEKSIELNPNDIMSYKIKAEIYGRLKRFDDALRAEQEALNLEPNDVYARIMMAYILKNMKRFEDALKEINKAIELNLEEDYDSYVIKEECLFELERFEEALDALEKAMKLKKDDFDMMGKARILAKLEKKEEALEIIRSLVEKEPENALYYDTYGEILMWSGDFEGAIKKYKKAIELIVTDTENTSDENFIHETYIKIGKCYGNVNQRELALKFVKKGKRLAEKKNDEYWMNRATIILKNLKDEKK